MTGDGTRSIRHAVQEYVAVRLALLDARDIIAGECPGLTKLAEHELLDLTDAFSCAEIELIMTARYELAQALKAIQEVQSLYGPEPVPETAGAEAA